ncbi:Serine/threonine-protein phosphatase 7 long form homolog [Linum perenne]
MVERWHPKTNTFHLYHDEAIITLEDIHFITGLTVDGLAVTSATLIPTESEKLQDYVQNLLEKRPTMSDLSSGRIKMTWLRSNFAYCKGAIRDDDIETPLQRWIIKLIFRSGYRGTGLRAKADGIHRVSHRHTTNLLLQCPVV